MSEPPRITLRTPVTADRDRLREWRNLPEISRWMYSDHAISAEEHARWFEAALKDPRRCYWIIEVDGAPVGLANLYDITHGAHTQKVSTENFMTRGDRVLFNSVVFDKEDIEGNKKYMMAIEDRRRIIASGTFILREEGPHYSGKVTFSEDEANLITEATIDLLDFYNVKIKRVGPWGGMAYAVLMVFGPRVATLVMERINANKPQGA